MYNTMKKILLITIGMVCVLLGAMGVILPILPTTPFLLVALWCFLRSSEKLHDYVKTNKYLGPFVADYISGDGIPLKAKKRAILLIWITIGFSIIFLIDPMFAKIILIVIATLVSIYIGTRSTKEVDNARFEN